MARPLVEGVPVREDLEVIAVVELRDDRKTRRSESGGPGGPGDPDSSESDSSSSDSSSYSSSSDSESEDETAERTLHNKDIDMKRKGVFIITSEKLLKAKRNKSRNHMRCEVDKFARGTDVNIIEWIVQMEIYFGISSLKPDAYVGFMLQKIAHPYIKEVMVYKNLEYLDFREKLVEVFGEPDMATAWLHELNNAEQKYGETIGEFMNRLRLLVLRAHPDLAHKDRDRILTTEFISGLRDQKLSLALSMASIQSSADAERKATEGESVRNNAKSKRETYAHYLPKQPEEQLEDSDSEAEGAVEGEGLKAAFGRQRVGDRGVAFDGRPFSSFSGKGHGGSTRGSMRGLCYTCGEAGHYQAHCPQRQEQAGVPNDSPVCSYCWGPHPVQLCMDYAASLREIPRAGGEEPLSRTVAQDVQAMSTCAKTSSTEAHLQIPQQAEAQSEQPMFTAEEAALLDLDMRQISAFLGDWTEEPESGEASMLMLESTTQSPNSVAILRARKRPELHVHDSDCIWIDKKFDQ